MQKDLQLGNLDAKRDWGYAKDYVEMMWLMLQQESPKDYVAASGKTYTVRQFVELAFKEIGVTLQWRGKEDKEVGVDIETGNTLVSVNPKYYRPAEVELLWGDPSLAKKELGWEAKTTLEQLVKIMVDYDLKYDTYGGDELKI